MANLYKTYRWQCVRNQALKRDHYECQWCAKQGKVVTADVVHHIKPSEQHPELMFALNNLVSLCRTCHETHHGRIRAGIVDERFPEWW